jgi:hypothetical protein
MGMGNIHSLIILFIIAKFFFISPELYHNTTWLTAINNLLLGNRLVEYAVRRWRDHERLGLSLEGLEGLGGLGGLGEGEYQNFALKKKLCELRVR